MKTLYIVANGTVTIDDGTIEVDGIESIRVAAMDERDALRIADMYDRGEIQPDNYWTGQGSVAACYEN